MTITWTKLRTGMWNGTARGQLVATITRTDCICTSSLPYTLAIPSLGIRSRHATPLEAKQEAALEYEYRD